MVETAQPDSGNSRDGLGSDSGGMPGGTMRSQQGNERSGSGSLAMAGDGNGRMPGGRDAESTGMSGGSMPSGADGTTNGSRWTTGAVMGSGGDDGGYEGGGSPGRRQCGAMEVHRRLLNTSAEYAAARSALENRTDLYLARDQRFDGVARIPVVVHVVYRTADQNLSQAQIDSQIDVLNRDFRATNPDVAIVPPVFRPLIADSRIEFHLAATDPTGQPTNGVTRTKTARTSFGTDDAVKSAATGGANAWPADRYLNLWVCQLTGGLLGYAQFPGGPAHTDGVVILHSAFGTTGTAAPPFNLGRTATHEIGHFLNLFHIWGDDGTGCSGSDEVDDTPNQAGENVGIPTFPHVTCNNGPNGDLFYDYMDYTDDAGMVMFTHGQAARMAACLDTVRQSLPGVSVVPQPADSVVSWGANRLDAFVLGTDRAMYHKWWDGSAWGPSVTTYENMGGVCMSAPEVATWGPNRLDAFVLGTDRALYHKWWDGSNWGPSVTAYENLGGVCMSPPEVVAWGENRLDVFVVGTDSALYHKWWDGSSWGPSLTDWEKLGGVCSTAPTVVSWGENRLDVFVLGTDSALYHKWWDGSSWGPSVTGYENLGGVCVDEPRVTSWAENRLDVFVVGTDSALYHKWWDGSNWGPSLTGYENLGGVVSDLRVVLPASATIDPVPRPAPTG